MKKMLTLSLIPVILAASIFMILESGEFYAHFYKDNIIKGYWAAILVEMFLTLFGIIYFKKRYKLNLLIKSIMTILFIVMVGGASLKIVNPMINEIYNVNKNEKLVNFLLQENEQSKKSLLYLKGQKTNTAIQTKYHREMTKEIINNISKETKSGYMIWINILFTTLLRVSVQCANLTLAHIFGILFRNNFKQKRKKKEKLNVVPHLTLQKKAK
jgi:hypothetical protein